MKMKLAIALLLSFISAPSFSCSCAALDSNVQESLTSSEKVFLGVPVRSFRRAGTDPFNAVQVTTFKVVSDFKGSQADKVTVLSNVSSAACGISPGVDSGVFLVFAYRDQAGKLRTSLCSARMVAPDNSDVTRTLKQLADLTN